MKRQCLRTPQALTCTRIVLACLVACLPLLSGCSVFDGMFSNVTVGEEEEVLKGVPPETRLQEGMTAYEVGHYKTAAKAFSTLLEEHPFSQEAMLAELKLADAYYYDGKYDEAKKHYQAFESRHPTNEAIPYVLFQYGMCDYSRADRVDRDPGSMRLAVESFTRLLNAAPNSPYSQEATRKIKDAQEFLAHHEYRVAEFYRRTGKEGAAKQRLQYLLSSYPESDLAPKAQRMLQELEGKPASESDRADAAVPPDASTIEADTGKTMD